MLQVNGIWDIMLTSSCLLSPKLPSQKCSNCKESTRIYEWIETHQRKEHICPTLSISRVAQSHWEMNSTQRKKLTLQRTQLGFFKLSHRCEFQHVWASSSCTLNICKAHQSPSEPMDRKSDFALCEQKKEGTI